MSIAVVYLASPRDWSHQKWTRLECLRSLLKLLKMFAPPWPVIIFHENYRTEDDAILPPQNAQFVADAIRSFQQSHQDQPDILYLLSQSPFIKDTFKRYAPSEVKVINTSVSRLLRTSDLACAAAYMVTPFSARRLMERITKAKTIPTDGFVHTAQMQGAIGIVVQADPTKGFMLNENWAEWNHKHDPSVTMP